MNPVRSKLLDGSWALIWFTLAFIGPSGIGSPVAGQGAFASRAEVARILHQESFNVFDRVKEIPSADLVSAGVIKTQDALKSFIVDPGGEFQSSDSWVDVKKPARQLVIAAINAKYELVCFWKATQGGPACYLMLVRRAGPDSRVIFYATLDEEVRKWADVKRLVSEDKITPLISAEHPHPYRD